MTLQRPLTLLLALALASCGDISQPAHDTTSVPDAPLVRSVDSQNDGYPDLTPAELVPEAEKGETGARNVLLAWARALELKEFDQAWMLFGEGGAQSGMTAAGYAAQFADYRDIIVEVADGSIEGGAGSLYYEVPTTISGTTMGGGPYRLTGTTVLRRVNDVDGATPTQLRWHLTTNTLTPG